MFIILIVVLFISFLLLWSMRIGLKNADRFEVFILFMFSSFLCQHINFKIFSAYDRLGVREELIPRILSYVHYGLILPSLLIWVLYSFRLHISNSKKVWISLSWLGFDLFSKQLYLVVKVLESKTISWYPIVDILISLCILFISILIMGKINAILKREKIIHE